MNTFETGSFVVNSDGVVEVDYLFDGGWFRGELAVFSLEGMESLEPGSDEFILEAARRSASNTEQGRIVVQDRLEGARFETDLGYEPNFNGGEYLDVKSFKMNPGDKVAFMLVPNTSIEKTLENPDSIDRFGRVPLFSIPEANSSESASAQFQFVEVASNGTIAVHDLPSDGVAREYNDLVFQVQGVDGELPALEGRIDAERDWRRTDIGQELLLYADSRIGNIAEEKDIKGDVPSEEPVDTTLQEFQASNRPEGVFTVGETGEINVDYLFDGGFLEGEIGIFNIEDLNLNNASSPEFFEEVITRVQSNSAQGHIIIQDAEQGAKYSGDLEWEADLNRGEYSGEQIYAMEPGDKFGLVLVPDGSFDDLLTTDEAIISQTLLFSIPKVNSNRQKQIAEVLSADEGLIVSFEDTQNSLQPSKDFNDVVFTLGGSTQSRISNIENVIGDDRNWLGTEIGEEVLGHFDMEAADESNQLRG